MIKTAVPNSTANRSKNEVRLSKKESSPGSQFIGATLSMSWQLAIVVLIPVVGGFKLDQHFNILPLWTIVGFIIAMAGAVLVIKKSLNEFSSELYSKDDK